MTDLTTDSDRRPSSPVNLGLRSRKSIGIACCRINNRRPEILLVCKRYTYAFNEFIHGKYNSSDSAALIALLSGMTVEEKQDILSLNFVQLWYRVWLNGAQRTANYFVAKNKFESTFVVDSGARLRRLVARSGNSNRIWEIPKGRKKNKSEANIHCAVREFYEETGIPKKNYKIFPEVTRSYSYIDSGTRYTNIYYVALAKYNIEPRINFMLQDQVEEICDIRWMNIDEIRFIDTTGRLGTFVRPVFNFVKKYAKM
jgi:8-oxo-dGTP pyrophosphatase MutT (NUDIX family)